MIFLGVPFVFYYFILFGLGYRLFLYLNRGKDKKKNLFTVIFIVTSLPLLIVDYFNYEYAAQDIRSHEYDFPYYKKLDFNQQVYYERCLISVGPFSRSLCRKLFDGAESLMVPTDKNLEARLETCHFDEPEWEPQSGDEVEHGIICDSAVETIDKEGTREEKLVVFNLILKKVKYFETCDERVNAAVELRGLSSLSEEDAKYRIHECLVNKCYQFCDYLSELKFYFDTTKDLKDDFVELNGERYYAERFAVYVMMNILERYGSISQKPLIFKDIYLKGHLVAYHRVGRLNYLVDLVEKVIKSEIPVEANIFDFNILRDKEKVEAYGRKYRSLRKRPKGAIYKPEG